MGQAPADAWGGGVLGGPARRSNNANGSPLGAGLVEIAPDPPDPPDIALDAFARYGKGQGHPARLNMDDCFAYAVAKRQAVPLLFKGDDFARTDIPAATPR